MSELKDIVPPLELCKHIPVREFEDSALVWVYWVTDERSFGNVVPRILKDQFSSTLPALGAALKAEVPAPTLEEILAKLPEGVQVRMRISKSGERHYQVFHYSYAQWTNRPAVAALRLWFKVRWSSND